MLNELGFDAGKPDGFSGPKTRNATREYQRANNLAIDGYVGYQLLIVYHPFNNILHYSEPQLQLQKYVFHLDPM
jgi:peptidoglycan hydrolase-like protein with peptidoglycan-binding domain